MNNYSVLHLHFSSEDTNFVFLFELQLNTYFIISSHKENGEYHMKYLQFTILNTKLINRQESIDYFNQRM